VIRGGSWNNNANNCRVGNRNNNWPDNANNNIGFRACLPPAHRACRMAACWPGRNPVPASCGTKSTCPAMAG